MPEGFKIGRPAKITPEIVRIVARDVGLGLPLEFALALLDEPVTKEAFNQSLAKPSFILSYTRQIAWQLREDIKTIREGDTKELRRLPGITFLLERRHREHFGKEPDMVVNNSVVLNGTPKDMLSMMREAARGRLKEAPIEVESKKL